MLSLVNATTKGSPDVANATAQAIAWQRRGQKLIATGAVARFDGGTPATKKLTIKAGTYPAESGLIDTLVAAIGTDDKKFSLTAAAYILKRIAGAIVAGDVALAAGTVPQAKWADYLVTVDAAGAVHVYAAAANFTTGYNSQALARAAVPATPAGELALVEITLQAAAAHPYIEATDALAGGASGFPAQATNYYVVAAMAFTATQEVSLPWDFGNGALSWGLPGALRSDQDETLIAELEPSGDGGITGHVDLFFVED